MWRVKVSSKHTIWLLMLCTCAAPVARQDERRVPRGWTLDASKQDMRAVNIREQKAFGEGKIIHADDFGAESLITEATLSPADGKAELKYLIEDYNKLLCINTAFEETIEEYEDKLCFATLRDIQMLEVHVATSVSALRNEDKWPEFRVELGGKDSEDKDSEVWAHALDGGSVIFRKMFPVKHEGKDIQGYNMKEAIQEIKLILKTDGRINKNGYINDYVVFKESFGGKFCIKRGRWTLQLDCKQHKTMESEVDIETNRLHIDRVEIYLYFADDDRPYKIFASNTSAQEPLVILDNVVREYSVAGFQNNPHWLLHFHSNRCEPWQEEHDGTEFGKYIWNKYIKQKNNSAIDVYKTPLHCAGVRTIPVYDDPVIPPEIDKISGLLDDVVVDKWLIDNENNFKPHADNNKIECQLRTAAIVKKEASEQNKCGTEPETPLEVPTDLDTWSAERLSNSVTEWKSYNHILTQSNIKCVSDLNKLTGSGCFYEKQLLGGIQVKITGQRLVSVGGKLMTRAKADACIFDETEDLSDPPEDNNVYINLGLTEQSYPLTGFSDINKAERGRFYMEGKMINEKYTKNFAVRDIKFLYLEKTAEEKFFSYKAVSKLTHNRIWISGLGGREDPTVTAVSKPVEQGIIAISSIELIFDGKVIYRRGHPPDVPEVEAEINCKEDEDKNDALEALFVLSNSNNVWVDYNVYGNKAWADYRDKIDHCVEAEE